MEVIKSALMVNKFGLEFLGLEWMILADKEDLLLQVTTEKYNTENYTNADILTLKSKEQIWENRYTMETMLILPIIVECLYIYKASNLMVKLDR